MKRIADYVDAIDSELHDSKTYAENSLYAKAQGNQEMAARWKEMSNDELKHATYLHDIAVEEIEILGRVYTPTAEMQKAWDESHKRYVEKVAWIKQMMTM